MEGGGQILRVCAALSCITGTPIRVRNIRAGRSTPGLRPQHLCGLQLLSQMTSGLLQGSEVGSTHITLEPRAVGGGAYTADTHTAGSVCLLLQASLPVSLFSNQRTDLVLKGGTETELAPHSDYTLKVFKPIVEKFGVQFDFDVVKRGFYPKGGGVVSVSVQPIRQLQPVVMETRGGVARITGTAFVAGVLPIKVTLMLMLKLTLMAVRLAVTTGGCLLASSALGKRGVSPEQVGVAAAEALLGNLRHGGCVDDFLQDQLVIFMALASGRSRIRTGPPTLHTRTAIHVAEALTKAKFTITKCEDASADANASASDSYLIECDGAGVENTDL
uniref:RNA 3'-terminal phosphate cyclase n=1 Tax=Salarias fasciatus TaxID=181472 RepID=A0A672G350_SALFA